MKTLDAPIPLHTPGPWTADRGGTVMADTPDAPLGFTTVAETYGESPEATRANMRLVAAAPDLLAALYDLAAAYCRLQGWQSMDDSRAANDPHLAMARAALAKTEPPDWPPRDREG